MVERPSRRVSEKDGCWRDDGILFPGDRLAGYGIVLTILAKGGNAEHGYSYQARWPDGRETWSMCMEARLEAGWELLPRHCPTASDLHMLQSRVVAPAPLPASRVA